MLKWATHILYCLHISAIWDVETRQDCFCHQLTAGERERQSVRLHAQLSQITAIVPLCCSIRQLQLSQYTCRWANRITGRSMSYPGTIGGAVPISTSGNRNTSDWPLYVTSCLGIRERWRTKSETKLHFCTFCIWYTWSLHKLDAQWRSCLRWFRRKSAAAILLLPAYGPERSPEPAQSAKSNLIRWNIYMQE